MSITSLELNKPPTLGLFGHYCNQPDCGNLGKSKGSKMKPWGLIKHLHDHKNAGAKPFLPYGEKGEISCNWIGPGIPVIKRALNCYTKTNGNCTHLINCTSILLKNGILRGGRD
jgi:hypothetical protein